MRDIHDKRHAVAGYAACLSTAMLLKGRLALRPKTVETCVTFVSPLACVAYLLTLAVVLGAVGAYPGSLDQADAYALIGPSPVRAGGGAQPDGRVYEEVSPPSKSGNYVASGGLPVTEHNGYAAAAADGNALLFLGSGAMGDAVSSVLGPYLARRSPSGWSTSSVMPPQVGVTVVGDPNRLLPSADFSRFVFGAVRPYSPEQPLGTSTSVDLYRTESPFVAPTWLGKPSIANPIPRPGENTQQGYLVAGASPSLSTVYFSYSGTLIPQDESRAPNVGDGIGGRTTAPWGFYEWADGAVHAAGVLPDGTLSPFGAVPAAVAGDGHFNGSDWQAGGFDNGVSADGARAFFVSPDPVASSVTEPGICEVEGPCATTAPELYVRETAADGTKRTVLVSQSQLPGHVGEPAPRGPVSVTDSVRNRNGAVDSSAVYASADGSQAFFASVDRLTQQAPEDASVKEYDFNLETGSLTYLPGVIGPIVAASRDGSDFLFKNTATSPQELDLWRAGAGGGHLAPVAQLPEANNIGEPYEGFTGIEARASSDGSVLVFDTNAPVPGFSNNRSGYGEVYRYDAAVNSLTCVSCAPVGVVPSGNANISYDNLGGTNSKPKSTVDTRAISADGSRVFFDTPDPLVPQAANSRRNVYEWERARVGSCSESQGCLYLISSGTSSEDAFYLDNSESGNDVFFNTSASLATNDVDEAYDAYDARIPHPGDTAPASQPAPCEGATCQTALTAPDLLRAPASVTISGSGNIPAAEAHPQSPKRKATKKKPRKRKRRSRTTRHPAKRSSAQAPKSRRGNQ